MSGGKKILGTIENAALLHRTNDVLTNLQFTDILELGLNCVKRVFCCVIRIRQTNIVVYRHEVLLTDMCVCVIQYYNRWRIDKGKKPLCLISSPL